MLSERDRARSFMVIYAVKISDISEDKLKELCLLIDSEKKYKIEKFVNKNHKIGTIIVEKLKMDNKYIRFNKNQYGKPCLEEYPDFHFNISHSRDYVLCAVDDKPIGIDVEEVKHIDYEEIAKNFFTAKEFEYIINQDLKMQLDRFCEM